MFSVNPWQKMSNNNLLFLSSKVHRLCFGLCFKAPQTMFLLLFSEQQSL